MADKSKSEIEMGPLTGSYDGHEYRLTIEEIVASSITLNEEDAQRLGRWLSREAGEDFGRQQAERQWRPENSGPGQ